MITETIAGKVSRALDSRLRAAKFVRNALNHVFPDHWSFMLGEIALYSFMVLLVTGTYLALFFHASPDKVIYHGSYHALDGQKISAAYSSVSLKPGCKMPKITQYNYVVWLWESVHVHFLHGFLKILDGVLTN